jgi:hypothetical protein
MPLLPPTLADGWRRLDGGVARGSDLQQQLDERHEDLAAARAANRELMARLNAPSLKR